MGIEMMPSYFTTCGRWESWSYPLTACVLGSAHLGNTVELALMAKARVSQP